MDEARNKVYQVVIIHGWGKNSQSNWFPWLKQELENRGYKVDVPNFPNTENPQLNNWLQTLNKVVEKPHDNLILVGHSLGSVTIMRYLQTLPKDKKITAAILVAALLKPNPDIEEGPILNFLQPKWGWENINTKAKKFFIINSNNDPYVPLKDAQEIAKKLEQELILMPGERHFNITSSPKYKKFPYLLKIFNQLEAHE